MEDNNPAEFPDVDDDVPPPEFNEVFQSEGVEAIDLSKGFLNSADKTVSFSVQGYYWLTIVLLFSQRCRGYKLQGQHLGQCESRLGEAGCTP